MKRLARGGWGPAVLSDFDLENGSTACVATRLDRTYSTLSGTSTKCTLLAESSTRPALETGLRHGRMMRLAQGGRGLAELNKDMKVTAKLHGLLPGLHQAIPLAKSVAFLWYLRHVSALDGTLYTETLNVHRFWTKAWSTAPLGSSSTRRPGDRSGSASTIFGHTSSRWNG